MHRRVCLDGRNSTGQNRIWKENNRKEITGRKISEGYPRLLLARNTGIVYTIRRNGCLYVCFALNDYSRERGIDYEAYDRKRNLQRTGEVPG